ncbi:BnaAnng14660D [Brassica napus]|uniref:BnaAnng14660D protein n=1 Tax=Brassica napus TaxID=3708 RepID=A0A078IZ15_BRANA|nr:BnaAnng14660D [Brassica napus]
MKQSSMVHSCSMLFRFVVFLISFSTTSTCRSSMLKKPCCKIGLTGGEIQDHYNLKTLDYWNMNDNHINMIKSTHLCRLNHSDNSMQMCVSYHYLRDSINSLNPSLVYKSIKKQRKNIKTYLISNLFEMDCIATKFLVVLLSLWLSCIHAIQTGRFPAILAFGDSILDTGNNNKLMTVSKSNFLPYGRNFPYHIPTGRFGNGRVLSDLVAEGLGIKNLVPAFRSSFLKSSDLPTGVCFASGGSGLDKFTASIQGVIWVQDQLKDFQSYIQKLSQEVGDAAKVKEIIANAVVLISAGNNDIAITFFATRAKKLRYNIETYTDQLIEWKTAFMQNLYNMGARKFAVLGTLPLGCLPGARQLSGDLICLPHVNHGAKIYNQKVANLVVNFRQSLPDGKFVYIDMYNSLLDVIENPSKYGFRTAKPCCCSVMTPIPCLDSGSHVFWDFAHPSEKAYKAVLPNIVSVISNKLA